MSTPRRGEIYWANLDPTIGPEIRKMDVRRLSDKLGQTDPAPALAILRAMFSA